MNSFSFQTIPDCDEFFDNYVQFRRDLRERPTNHKRGNFLNGWHHAANDHRTYQEHSMVDLTWQNLGNRLGKHYGTASEVEICRVFELFARQYRMPRSTGADVLVVASEEDELGLEEGESSSVKFTSRHRNSEVRGRCLDHHGNRCFICKMSFLESYGVSGNRCIQVHHLTPIGSGDVRVTDPVRDAVPLCPNCHSFVHTEPHPISIQRAITIYEAYNTSPC